jgi:glutamate-5-semialdehyde dehydrogenase
MVDRLRLTHERIDSMVKGLRQLIELPDPVGAVLETKERPNGLEINKVRVPIGVIGIIYESRPNVTIDCAGTLPKIWKCLNFARREGSDALEPGDGLDHHRSTSRITASG